MMYHFILLLASTTSVIHALTIPHPAPKCEKAVAFNKRDDLNPPNPYDLSWVQTYSAIGDSYSAGIGEGKVIDEGCSRYDAGFPQLVDITISSTPKVKNIACTGATSKDILEKQVSQLEDGKSDLITVTAGGNDVGFTDVLKACVYLSTTQEKCDQAIDDARKKIDDVLKKDVDALLQGLAGKLTDQGLVVYVLYEKFWNEADNYCNDQTWSFFDKLAIAKGLKLTVDNRKAMNKLVDDVNLAIEQVVASASGGTRQPIAIQPADWGKSVQDAKGWFCADAEEKDAAGSDDILMFIRENGSPYPGDQPSRKLRYMARQLDGNDTDLVGSADLATRAELLDSSSAHPQPVNRALPDAIAKVFHPSFQGHQAITDAVYAALVRGRAKNLKVDPTVLPCKSFTIPGLKCFTDDNGDWKATDKWTTQKAASDAVDEFCKGGKKSVNAPNDDELKGGKYYLEDTFGKGTVNELKLRIDIFQNKDLSEEDCKSNFHNTIDGCDGNQPDKNPKNLKYGGTKDLDGGKGAGFVFTFQPQTGKAGQVDVTCHDLVEDVNKAKFMSATVLTTNSDDFAKFITDPASKPGSSGEKTYNDNSIDKVIISWKWPDGASPPDADDLKDGLGKANGGCQVPHDDYNPSNFKYGADIKIGEATITIQPQENNSIKDGTNYGKLLGDETERGDTGLDGKKIDKPTLQNCLRGMDQDWTEKKECNGMVLFRILSEGGWQSITDCHNACKNAISEQINLGAKRAMCRAEAGVFGAACTLGFTSTSY